MSQILRRPLFDVIKDDATRESIQWMYDYLQAIALLQGQFVHFELQFTAAVTSEKISHRLGFTPKDIIVTSLIGPGTVTFNYSEFTNDVLSITTNGAATVRFFGGAYE